MRVLLICVGSRGDAEPFCSLAAELLSSGHSVDFFLQKDMHQLAPTAAGDGMQLHTLPFETNDFYRFTSNPSHGQDHENPRVRFVGIIADVIGELVLPCWKEVLDVANKCQAIVTSSLARSLCFAITQKMDIPTFLVLLQPLVPTSAFPHYSQVDDCVNDILAMEDSSSTKSKEHEQKNLDSYWFLEKYQHEFLQDRLDNTYKSMGLEESMLQYTELQKMLSGNHPRVRIFNAYSDKIIPSVTDVGPNVHHVGPLADGYLPADFSPPDENVVEFLKTKHPICIGYGSMPYSKVDMVLEALEELKQAAILVGGGLAIPCEKNGDEWIQENVRQVSSLPYSWLLPQCSAMLCHGGAGVVHATLRAGIPIVISPMIGDQFFFAKFLPKKGLGTTQAGDTLPQMTKEDLKTAIQSLTPDCKSAAKEIGEQIRAQIPGVKQTVEILEKEFN